MEFLNFKAESKSTRKSGDIPKSLDIFFRSEKDLLNFLSEKAQIDVLNNKLYPREFHGNSKPKISEGEMAIWNKNEEIYMIYKKNGKLYMSKMEES